MLDHRRRKTRRAKTRKRNFDDMSSKDEDIVDNIGSSPGAENITPAT